MSAAAAKIEKKLRGLTRENFEVINGDIAYDGAGAALRTFDHGTSGDIGRASPYTKAAGELFAGYFDTPHQQAQAGGSAVSVTGDTSATPPPTAGIAMEDVILENVAVSGVTARTDFGRPVYSSTDNLRTDLTLTRPSAPAEAVGVVWRYRASGYADVLMFGLRSRIAMQRPGAVEHLILGVLDFGASADGNLIAAKLIQFKCRVISLHAQVITACAGSGGTIAINLEKGGNDLTGGVLTWSTAAMTTAGVIHDASAITQNAHTIWNEGSSIDVEGASAGGTRTSGQILLFAKVERLLGL